MRRLIGVAAMLFAATGPVRAQYDEPAHEGPSFESRYITLGAVNREFKPLGSNSLSDSLIIRYTRIMPMITYRQGMGELYFGYTTFTLSDGSKSTILFGGKFGTEVPLIGKRPSALLFPLVLAADYTKAEGIGPSREDFNIASVGIGGGLKYRYFTRELEFTVEAVEFAQFASEGIGVGNGFSGVTSGDAVLLWRDAGLLDGVVLGYRFRLQTWSMSETKFNYQSISHGPYLGIMF